MVAVESILQGKEICSHLPNAAATVEYQCFGYLILVLLDKVSVSYGCLSWDLLQQEQRCQGAERDRAVAGAAATAHATFGDGSIKR